MNIKRGNTYQTSVQILAILLTLSLSPLAFAQKVDGLPGPSSGAPNNNGGNNNNAGGNNNNATAFGGQRNAEQQIAVDRASSCESNRRDALAAAKEIENACNDGGLGSGGECIAKAMTCKVVTQKKVADDKESLTESLMQAFAASKGIDMNSVNRDIGAKGSSNDVDGQCPQFSGADYKTRKESLEKEIKDLEKDKSDAEKEISKEKETTAKEMAKLTKDVQETKSKNDTAKADGKKALSSDIDAIVKSQAEIKGQIAQASNELIKKRTELLEAAHQKSSALLQLNTDSTKDSCVLKAQNDYAEKMKAFPGSQPMYILKFVRSYVMHGYDTCMQVFEQKRAEVVRAARAKEEELTNLINSAEGSLNDAKKSIDSNQSKIAQLEADAKTRDGQLDQSLLESMKTAQTEMQASQTKLQEQSAIAAQKTQSYMKKANEKQNELNSLGPIPDPSATTASTKVAGKIRGSITVIADYLSGSCCTDNKANCGGALKDYKTAFDQANNSSDEDGGGKDDDPTPSSLRPNKKSSRSHGGGS